MDDTLTADEVSLEDLKHWELAPFNAPILAENDIPFAITSSGAEADFWNNLRTAVKNGLPQKQAIDAITRVPANALGLTGIVGQLTPSALANFMRTGYRVSAM